MKRYISILLCIPIIFACLSGCTIKRHDDNNGSAKKATIVGTWERELNLNDEVDENLDYDVKEFINLNKIKPVKLTMVFKSNGTCITRTDSKEFKSSLYTEMERAIESSYYDFIERNDYDYMPFEQYYKNIGATIDELIDTSINMEEIESYLDNYNEDGVYKAEDGKLYVGYDDTDLAECIDKGYYLDYKLTNSKLVITDGYEEMNYKRVK